MVFCACYSACYTWCVLWTRYPRQYFCFKDINNNKKGWYTIISGYSRHALFHHVHLFEIRIVSKTFLYCINLVPRSMLVAVTTVKNILCSLKSSATPHFFQSRHPSPPSQVPGIIVSVLGLVGPVSVYWDWVRWKVWTATSISMWQRVKLSEQIHPWDTLACCWDAKQQTNPLPKKVWKQQQSPTTS